MTIRHGRQRYRPGAAMFEPAGESADRPTPVMTDVAQAAGVSRATVSRVLTGSYPVSPSTQKRVRKAVADLGYRRSAAARALVLGRSDLVAVVADMSSIAATQIVQGIAARARNDGQPVMITTPSGDQPGIAEATALLADHGVRDVIVVTAGSLQGLNDRHAPAGMRLVTVEVTESPDHARVEVGSKSAAMRDLEQLGCTTYEAVVAHREEQR